MATSRTGTSKYKNARTTSLHYARNHDVPCAICGGQIMWDAHKDDPAAPQWDHVVPFSVNGGRENLTDGMAWTHRRCNIAKSNGQHRLSSQPLQPRHAAAGQKCYCPAHNSWTTRNDHGNTACCNGLPCSQDWR